jgi:hypothetical protein
MGQMIIINAPTSFTAIWTVVKPWLSPRTLDKITVLGTNTNQHHAALRDLVAPENLPVTLGGTCTCDGAHGGCVLSNAGPWMDEGRSERRASWLRGEIAAPGVPLLPRLKKTQVAQKKVETETEVGSCVAAANSIPTPMTSWGRASVVGLPLPLPHSTAVRLVV